MIDFLKMLIEVALSRQKFGKQYGAACRAAQGIVRKTYKFIVEEVVLSQSSAKHSHSVFKVSVKLDRKSVV